MLFGVIDIIPFLHASPSETMVHHDSTRRYHTACGELSEAVKEYEKKRSTQNVIF